MSHTILNRLAHQFLCLIWLHLLLTALQLPEKCDPFSDVILRQIQLPWCLPRWHLVRSDGLLGTDHFGPLFRQLAFFLGRKYDRMVHGIIRNILRPQHRILIRGLVLGPEHIKHPFKGLWSYFYHWGSECVGCPLL